MNIMSRRIIGRDVASTEMVVSVGLTSEFCELGCIGLTWYERVGCGNGVGSMARAGGDSIEECPSWTMLKG